MCLYFVTSESCTGGNIFVMFLDDREGIEKGLDNSHILLLAAPTSYRDLLNVIFYLQSLTIELFCSGTTQKNW